MIKAFNNIDVSKHICLIVLLLMGIGTVFVYSAGVNLSSEVTLENFFKSIRLRNMIYLPIAIGVMYGFSLFNYRWLRLGDRPLKSFVVWLVIVSFVLLVAVLIFGKEVNFAKRWLSISIGGVKVNFQPSEFAKWVSIFFAAAYLDRYRYKMGLYAKKFLPLCGIIGAMMFLIVLEDFGTAAFIGMMFAIMLMIGGAVWWHILSPVPLAAAGLVAAILSSPTRINRIRAFIDPASFAGTTGYQARQSLVAITLGGLWGRGIGNGISNYGHLPEDTTDFIFAIIAHELGFVGCVLIIGLYVCFVWCGMIVVKRCRDNFGKMVAAGIVMCIAIQALINIGVVTVVLPTKGIPLPFVSAGGTSMLLGAAVVGVLLNIARQNQGEVVEVMSIEGDEYE